MIEILEASTENAFGVRLSGAIDQTQYQAMRPEFERRLAKGDVLNGVLQIEADADVEPTVLWDDLQFALGHSDQIGRVAIVANKAWAPFVEIMQEHGLAARQFAPAEAAAWSWAAGD